MFIRELAHATGVSTKTIRYYEAIGLLPRPMRAANNYRQYSPAIQTRLRFIVSARHLGFSLNDIARFLAARGDGLLPCQRAVDSLDGRIAEIDCRIAELVALRQGLEQIRTQGKRSLKQQGAEGQCVCDLLAVQDERGTEQGEVNTC